MINKLSYINFLMIMFYLYNASASSSFKCEFLFSTSIIDRILSTSNTVDQVSKQSKDLPLAHTITFRQTSQNEQKARAILNSYAPNIIPINYDFSYQHLKKLIDGKSYIIYMDQFLNLFDVDVHKIAKTENKEVAQIIANLRLSIGNNIFRHFYSEKQIFEANVLNAKLIELAKRPILLNDFLIFINHVFYNKIPLESLLTLVSIRATYQDLPQADQMKYAQVLTEAIDAMVRTALYSYHANAVTPEFINAFIILCDRNIEALTSLIALRITLPPSIQQQFATFLNIHRNSNKIKVDLSYSISIYLINYSPYSQTAFSFIDAMLSRTDLSPEDLDMFQNAKNKLSKKDN